MGSSDALLPVSTRYPENHLHDQYSGRVSPTTSKSDQDEISFYQRQRAHETTLSGHRKHYRKVEFAPAKLVSDLLAIGHLLPGTNPNTPSTVNLFSGYQSLLRLRKLRLAVTLIAGKRLQRITLTQKSEHSRQFEE